jgi:hypothetical protein
MDALLGRARHLVPGPMGKPCSLGGRFFDSEEHEVSDQCLLPIEEEGRYRLILLTAPPGHRRYDKAGS